LRWNRVLEGIHFILSYTCNLECDHCFVYSGPKAPGTFSVRQIRLVLEQAAKLGTIRWIYFEGGEPFLFYPLMIEGVRRARRMGFEVGVVTNAYFATSEEDAELWLRPLADLRISDLSVSDDPFHYQDSEDNPPKRAIACARKLGMPVDSICIEDPTVNVETGKASEKGAPVVGGGAMFRGRAVEKLVEKLPRRRWQEFTECPYEDLRFPGRVHVDCYGNVHICQGVIMGNFQETDLTRIVEDYTADEHPVCGPLAKGGPALLAEVYNLDHEETYVDACHFCYSLRLSLLDKFPKYLAPRQVYGFD
jgi:organic radical activating enzyme